MNIIDLVYLPFRRIFSIQTFRYVCCGSFVTALGIVVYYFSYHFLLDCFFTEKIINGQYTEQIVIGRFLLTKYLSAYLVSLVVSFPLGFYLSRSVVFQDSQLTGKIQLLLYVLLHLLNAILNYFLLYFLVEYCGFWVTPSQFIATIVIAGFSYYFQKHISFYRQRQPVLSAKLFTTQENRQRHKI
ncbi:hypothetical protein FEM33_07095 [Dyadobacter flavalbus]|uniref:GtrA/DPMS transmembrane domain-containing protein n=1 Tax=Dyadobacter flavalbus TaxID=2579942 RepID=A0A5M8R040_9BACT|nr:hypothetical protein FEM33_07095 [Dyadobacter flavalbus]